MIYNVTTKSIYNKKRDIGNAWIMGHLFKTSWKHDENK